MTKIHAVITCGILLTFGSVALAEVSLDTPVNYALGDSPSGVTSGDFDGDLQIDLATTLDNPDRIAVLLNVGGGSYALGPVTPLPNSSTPQDIISGHFDDDDFMDLAVAVRDPSGAVLIYLGNGDGTFSFEDSIAVGDRPRGLSAADMDNDMDLDLAVANRDSDTAHVLTNLGLAVFSPQTLTTGGEPRATTFINIDDDDDLDLAVTNHDDRSVSLYTNNAGTFMFSEDLSVGGQVRPDGVDSADLDGNGNTDLAVAVSDATLGINQAAVFLNTAGTFSGPFGYDTDGTNTSGIVAADLDCDNLPELITSNQDSGDVSVLPNTGGAVFGAAMVVPVGLTPENLTAANLDANAGIDFAVINRDSNDLTVMLNQSCTAIPGDVDGDGDVDVTDLLALIAAWGPCPGCPADTDGDNDVDVSDLLILLANWG